MSAKPTGAFEEWFATRPPSVRKLAAEFPLGMEIKHEGKVLYLIGYNESDMLVFSPVDPSKDYDLAYFMRCHICADHLR